MNISVKDLLLNKKAEDYKEYILSSMGMSETINYIFFQCFDKLNKYSNELKGNKSLEKYENVAIDIKNRISILEEIDCQDYAELYSKISELKGKDILNMDFEELEEIIKEISKKLNINIISIDKF